MTIPNTPAFGSVAATVTGTITVPWGSGFTVTASGVGAASLPDATSGAVYELAIAAIAGTSTAAMSLANDTVTLTITRLDGGSGSVLVSNGVPLIPGVYTKTMADAKKGKLTIGGSERTVYACGMGRHPDDSYRTLFLQFTADTDTETTATLDLTAVRAYTSTPGDLDETYTTVDDAVGYFENTTTHLPPTDAMNNPLLLGLPYAVALPTDADYLIASNIAGPGLAKPAQTDALTGTKVGGSTTMGAYSSVTDDRFDYWLRDLHTLGQGTATHKLADKTLTNYPDSNRYDTTQPTPWTTGKPEPPEYYDWRQAVSTPDDGFTNTAAYGRAHGYFQMWARTGDIQYWKYGVSSAWCVAYQERYTVWYYDDSTYHIMPHYSTYIRVQPSGFAAAFLTTGDETPLFFLIAPGSGDSYGYGWGMKKSESGGISAIGDWTDYNSEPRPLAHILMGVHEAWMCTRAHAESNPLCDEWQCGESSSRRQDYAGILSDMLTSVLTGTGLVSDGIWVNKPAWPPCNSSLTDPEDWVVVNTFMEALVTEALVRLYEDGPTTLTMRSSIPAAIQACISFCYNTYFGDTGGATKSFRNWFIDSDCTPSSAWPATYDLTSMYSSTAAWCYYNTANTTYRTMARDILGNAVGEGTVDTELDGDPLGHGPYLTGHKQTCEHFMNIMPGFGWLVKAGG